MTDDLLYTTSGACIFKAGENHSPISEENMNKLGIMAEGVIHSTMRQDLSGANLTESVKGILSDVESSLIAIPIIERNMSTFTSRGYAESMMTTLRDGALRGLSLLKDKKVQKFMTEDKN